MKKWECSVCGYIHEGEEPPLKCPVCKADQSKFVEIKVSEEAVSQVEVDKDAGATSTADLSQDPPTMIDKISDAIVENHLHPISVHSPNGIVPMAVIFLVLALLFQSSGLANAAYYNMIAVLLSMPAVIVSGYVTWQKKYNGANTSVFRNKIVASAIATVTLLVLIIWKIAQPDVMTTASAGRWIFLLFSLILLASVGLAGHLGGQLVFAGKK